ncbi:hypothetical protein [Mesorhizobium muleiense]|uniref:hypothetical protein n=1 Tax=Mesorhizobium muleiense TaxID=1004279 RepID=UPI001F21BC98|nr:hypothetical protein [Mesorhizobium muleiense]
MTSSDPLLQPYQLKHLTLKNRVMSTSHEPAFSEDGMDLKITSDLIWWRAAEPPHGEPPGTSVRSARCARRRLAARHRTIS